MLRQLLTLLAVFFGLGLVAAPAQATEVSQISVAITDDVEDCKTVVGPVLHAHARRLGEASNPVLFSRSRLVIAVPTVILSADRAHE